MLRCNTPVFCGSRMTLRPANVGSSTRQTSPCCMIQEPCRHGVCCIAGPALVRYPPLQAAPLSAPPSFPRPVARPGGLPLWLALHQAQLPHLPALPNFSCPPYPSPPHLAVCRVAISHCGRQANSAVLPSRMAQLLQRSCSRTRIQQLLRSAVQVHILSVSAICPDATWEVGQHRLLARRVWRWQSVCG